MENGKKVKRIYFGNGGELASSEDLNLSFSYEHHGTYHINWIVQKDKAGVEKSRHNFLFLESIIWE